MTMQAPPTNDAVGASVDALRAQVPLVQCLTNTVVAQITANVLLAAGAAPAMVDAPEEASEFARIAGAVLVNVGTINASTAAAMREATAAATDAGTPWVLDPVALGALGFRTQLAQALLEHRPTVVRGNSSEILALAGTGAGGRGVDSTDAVSAAAAAGLALAKRTRGAVAISGQADLILGVGSDGQTDGVWVDGGDPMLQLVTGTGCALGALVAAYTAVTKDPVLAAVAAHAHTGLAAQLAVESGNARGPGSFAVAWLDGLAQIDGALLASRISLRPFESGPFESGEVGA